VPAAEAMMPFEIKITKTIADKQEERIKAWIDRIVAFIAVFSSAIAIVVAIVAHKDAKDSLKTQIESVDNQITAQQVSVEPVVVVEPIPVNPANDAASVNLHFIMSARGQTPAIAVTARVECVNYANDFSGLVQRLDQPAKIPLDDTLIGVLTDKDTHDFYCGIDRDPVTKSLHGKIAIRAKYSDVFTNEHQITYFLGMNVPNVPFGGPMHFRYMLPPEIKVKYAQRR
jgi:hypothetical protein